MSSSSNIPTLINHTTVQQEEFSYAFINTIVAAAGYSVHLKSRSMDNSGIDIGVEVPGELGRVLSPSFNAQVKCTTQTQYVKETHIKYPLKTENYKRLIHPSPSVPQLLILVFVPRDVSEWLKSTEKNLIIQKAAYWMSLRGSQDTPNTGSITIDIPRTHLLTPQSLQQLMQCIAAKKL